MSESVPATPDVPDIQNTQSPSNRSAVKVATPDLILFNESSIPVDIMTDLLFEDVGGQEIISIARNDIVNGQEVSYNLIGNLNGLERRYNSKNIFSLPDTIEKYFGNFSIRFDIHIPEEGTAPPVYYVGDPNSVSGCSGYPILKRYTDELISCVSIITGFESLALRNAQKIAEELSKPRNIAYIEPQTGDLIIDVINMETNERVDIEVLRSGSALGDTIYMEES
jgi:hypothetical protein